MTDRLTQAEQKLEAVKRSIPVRMGAQGRIGAEPTNINDLVAAVELLIAEIRSIRGDENPRPGQRVP